MSPTEGVHGIIMIGIIISIINTDNDGIDARMGTDTADKMHLNWCFFLLERWASA